MSSEQVMNKVEIFFNKCTYTEQDRDVFEQVHVCNDQVSDVLKQVHK